MQGRVDGHGHEQEKAAPPPRVAKPEEPPVDTATRVMRGSEFALRTLENAKRVIASLVVPSNVVVMPVPAEAPAAEQIETKAEAPVAPVVTAPTVIEVPAPAVTSERDAKLEDKIERSAKRDLVSAKEQLLAATKANAA